MPVADIVAPEIRSRMMASIRGKNTQPELFIRRGLHVMGFRYRLHDKKLAGKPDIVFPRYRAVMFVNGCFWHGHDCAMFRMPKTHTEFWKDKIERNRLNDREVQEILLKAGWRLAFVWECALKGPHRLPKNDVLNRCSDWIRSDNAILEIRGE